MRLWYRLYVKYTTNPRHNQPRNTSQVSRCSASMSASDTSTPMMGTNGTHGVLNGRGRSGSRTRRIHTPAQTIVKANRVPMLVSSASVETGNDAASVATQIPTRIVEMYGVRNFG